MTWIPIWFKSIDSTQTYLKAHWQEHPHKTYVVADQQTSGLGRESRSWNSPEGGLYFSVLLKPQRLQPLLAWRVWWNTLETLETLTQKTLQPKAPNDILFDSRKLAGTLIDSAIQGEKALYYIIGMGINITTTQDVADNSCALEAVLNPPPSRTEVLRTWLEKFDHQSTLTDKMWREDLLAHSGHRNIQMGYETPQFIPLKEYWHAHQ